MIRVLLADDHPIVRAGIRSVLTQVPDIKVVGEADNGQEALRLIEELCPDIVLLDCRLQGGLDGVTVAERIQAANWPVHVVALSAFDDDRLVCGMLRANASGYMLKQEAPEHIVEAVRAVARGENWFSAAIAPKVTAWLHGERPEEIGLTARELDALRLLACGFTNAQIAETMVIAERTVRFHMEKIMTKLGVSNRTEVVLATIQQGWIEPYR